MARLLELTRGLRVGHPFTDGVHVGPLIGEKHRQSVIEYVELAKREGGRVLCGGEIPADPALANGSFFLPTIIGLRPGGGDLDARYRARPASQRAAGGWHGVDQHLQGFCDFDPVRGL